MQRRYNMPLLNFGGRRRAKAKTQWLSGEPNGANGLLPFVKVCWSRPPTAHGHAGMNFRVLAFHIPRGFGFAECRYRWTTLQLGNTIFCAPTRRLRRQWQKVSLMWARATIDGLAATNMVASLLWLLAHSSTASLRTPWCCRRSCSCCMVSHGTWPSHRAWLSPISEAWLGMACVRLHWHKAWVPSLWVLPWKAEIVKLLPLWSMCLTPNPIPISNGKARLGVSENPQRCWSFWVFERFLVNVPLVLAQLFFYGTF